MNKGKQTILVAEDNEINRELLVDLLKEEYDIKEAVDGQETIDILNECKDEIAALLLDIVMPVKTGYDVLEYMTKEHIT